MPMRNTAHLCFPLSNIPDVLKKKSQPLAAEINMLLTKGATILMQRNWLQIAFTACAKGSCGHVFATEQAMGMLLHPCVTWQFRRLLYQRFVSQMFASASPLHNSSHCVQDSSPILPLQWEKTAAKEPRAHHGWIPRGFFFFFAYLGCLQLDSPEEKCSDRHRQKSLVPLVVREKTESPQVQLFPATAWWCEPFSHPTPVTVCPGNKSQGMQRSKMATGSLKAEAESPGMPQKHLVGLSRWPLLWLNPQLSTPGPYFSTWWRLGIIKATRSPSPATLVFDGWGGNRIFPVPFLWANMTA